MDSTGGSALKAEDGKKSNELHKDKWKYLPSIQEQGLIDKS